MPVLKGTRKSLFLRNKNLLGIDIGARSIKLVEVKRRNPPKIAALGAIPTPTGALENGVIVNSDAIGRVLRALWQQSGAETRQAATVVSGKNIITRYIKLPKMTPKEVESTLKWDAEKYVPVSDNSNLIMEHMILGEMEEDFTSQIRVLLVAAPRQMVNSAYEAFKLAGLELAAVEIEPISLWRSLGRNIVLSTNQAVKQDEAFIVLDIGAKGSNFTVFQGKDLKFSRYIATGGDSITQFLMQGAGLDFESAQAIKEKEGELLSPESLKDSTEEKNQLCQLIQDGIAPLMSEISRSIDFYRSQFNKTQPKALVLSGGTAKLKGIDVFLSSQLGIPVVRGLQNIILPDQFIKLSYGVKTIDPAFGVALGLALREVTE